MFCDAKDVSITLQSMSEMFTGIQLSGEEAKKLTPMLQMFMREIDLLREVDTQALEPVLPPTWKEGRFGL
ncbi:hypothetical protein [Alicyclobacillus fodiniaquatilis]|jgi:hypothetical protein|uniref:Uncharacterized protein n=1 Tax=Alicyclobacillus fodiniaquatilis TaxID=1661150 RepID=A0ABW4JRF7_9BACL